MPRVCANEAFFKTGRKSGPGRNGMRPAEFFFQLKQRFGEIIRAAASHRRPAAQRRLKGNFILPMQRYRSSIRALHFLRFSANARTRSPSLPCFRMRLRSAIFSFPFSLAGAIFFLAVERDGISLTSREPWRLERPSGIRGQFDFI